MLRMRIRWNVHFFLGLLIFCYSGTSVFFLFDLYAVRHFVCVGALITL